MLLFFFFLLIYSCFPYNLCLSGGKAFACNQFCSILVFLFVKITGKFDNIIKQLPDTWDACPLNSASEQHMLTTSAEGYVNNMSLLWSLLGSALGLILLALAISIVAYQIYIQHKKLSRERIGKQLLIDCVID